jgi:hypothetical protein
MVCIAPLLCHPGKLMTIFVEKIQQMLLPHSGADRGADNFRIHQAIPTDYDSEYI